MIPHGGEADNLGMTGVKDPAERCKKRGRLIDFAFDPALPGFYVKRVELADGDRITRGRPLDVVLECTPYLERTLFSWHV